MKAKLKDWVGTLAEKHKGSYACSDCMYFKDHRCKLWEVSVKEHDASHCESLRVR